LPWSPAVVGMKLKAFTFDKVGGVVALTITAVTLVQSLKASA